MLTLRSYTHADTEKLVELANNPNISRYGTDSFPYPYTIEDAKWWIQTGSLNGTVRAIENDGIFVGGISVLPGQGERKRQANLGYWLGEPFWGMGLAAQAVALLEEEVFSSTDIAKLSAWVFSVNQASIRVLEKCGFHREAILQKSLYKNGEFYDEHIYAKFNS